MIKPSGMKRKGFTGKFAMGEEGVVCEVGWVGAKVIGGETSGVGISVAGFWRGVILLWREVVTCDRMPK
jgi:hypothetical protein